MAEGPRVRAADLGLSRVDGEPYAEGCVRLGREVLGYYSHLAGGEGEEFETTASDLIADLLHVADEEGVDIWELLERARSAHDHDGDDDPLPEPTVCANCDQKVEPDDGGAIWYHADTMEPWCDPEGPHYADRTATPSDVAPCINAGEHLRSQRHRRADCPTAG
jgi:hypothetical protein